MFYVRKWRKRGVIKVRSGECGEVENRGLRVK